MSGENTIVNSKILLMETSIVYIALGIIAFFLVLLIMRWIFRIDRMVRLQEFQLRTLVEIAEKQGVDVRRIKYDFERMNDKSDALPPKFEEAK